ncbi:hypothetical protein ACHAPT_011337 [Fusarium lateritium]
MVSSLLFTQAVFFQFEAKLPARKFRTYQCDPTVEDAEPRTSKEEAEIAVIEDVEKIPRSQS